MRGASYHLVKVAVLQAAGRGGHTLIAVEFNARILNLGNFRILPAEVRIPLLLACLIFSSSSSLIVISQITFE